MTPKEALFKLVITIGHLGSEAMREQLKEPLETLAEYINKQKGEEDE